MSARWLASVALYALAAALLAPAIYGAGGLYLWLWGIPWPSQSWGFWGGASAFVMHMLGWATWAVADGVSRKD